MAGSTRIVTRRATMLLLAAIVLCVALMAGFWFAITVPPVRAPHLSFEPLPDEPDLTGLQLAQAVERPLFWQGRRPVEEIVQPDTLEPSPDMPPPDELEGVKLSGIIMNNSVRTALLLIGKKVQQVRVHDQVLDWTVSKITATEVFFASGSEQRVLTLARDRHESIQLEAQP